MAERTMPGIGLTAFWDLGADGWNAGMDANLRLLSALVQPRALDHVAATPGSPSDGDIYLFTAAHATQPNKVAIRDNGTWVYVTPVSGWLVYDVAAGFYRQFDGTAWGELTTTSSDTTHDWELVIAVSDETTALTTGASKVTFRMPRAVTLTAVRATVTTAPTGAALIVDINEAGSTILSTKLSIDASEKTSATAASAAVISDAALADDAEMTIDIDQVGSTVAGAGLKVLLKGTY